MNKSSVIENFLTYHNIRIADEFREDELAILWLHAIKQCVDESIATHCRQLVETNDPSWAMLRTMLDRVYEHAAASIICYYTGGWASLEVVVRAVIEAATTVIYTTQEDRHTRVGQYLTNYFVMARKAIEKIDPSRRNEARINLDFREEVIRKLAANEGLPFEVVGWPHKVIDRFSAVGMEEVYRNLYTVLSGQMHNDADSLIDFVIRKCLSQQNSEINQLAADEMHYWMRFYLYSGLRFYAVAANRFSESLELVGAITETKRVELELDDYVNSLIKQFRSSVQNADV